MPPKAIVTHSIRGRARLRVEDRKGRASWFDDIARALAKHGDVREVRVNAGTGSILVRHAGELSELLDWAKKEALFDTAHDGTARKAPSSFPMPPTADAAWRVVERLDRRLRESEKARLDLRSYAFYGLAAAGLFQIARGEFFPPATSLMQTALELAQAAYRDLPREVSPEPASTPEDERAPHN